ncbi:MAG: hypothetical protein A2X42_11525 [Candidatus Margulisbacteria bacterium GWF2_38_17]|nr:MAG: hypothetical protein A2X42_11525 [Candidatus Margulisbacteria bacterium GWF2_38_17]
MKTSSTSLLSSLKAEPKLLLFTIYFILNLSISTFTIKQLIFSAALIFLLYLSKQPIHFYLKKITHILPFLALIICLLPFRHDPNAQVIVNLGFINIYDKGSLIAGLLYYKAITSIILLHLIITTTEKNDLLNFACKLRIPHLLIDICMIAWRYQGIVQQEYLHIKNSTLSRGLKVSRLQSTTLFGNILTGLLVKSLHKAHYVHYAMIARGYQVHRPLLHKKTKKNHISFRDIIFAQAMVGMFLCGLFL